MLELDTNISLCSKNMWLWINYVLLYPFLICEGIEDYQNENFIWSINYFIIMKTCSVSPGPVIAHSVFSVTVDYDRQESQLLYWRDACYGDENPGYALLP